MAFLDASRDAQEAARVEAEIERQWLAGWSYVPLAIVALFFLWLQPYIASYRWPFSIILDLASSLGEDWRDWLLDATWIPHVLAGTPAAVAYLVLAPYARKLFGRAALAHVQRRARGVEPGDTHGPAAPAAAVAAVDAHSTVYAGFGRRAAAAVVDWALCLAAAYVSLYGLFELRLFNSVDNLVFVVLLAWIVIFLLYHVLSWTSGHQATPGMWLAGIFVTDVRGRRLGWLRATGRHFARFLSYYTVGLGFLMQLWDDRRQALHDRLSGTVVLRRPRAVTPRS
jgi:uncharacterized RDD family membrane protein YckC